MRDVWEKGSQKISSSETSQKATVKIVDGTFDDFSKAGVEPGSVDLVVIAQAWHWCPDHEAAFVSQLIRSRHGNADLRQTEIAKYLSPSGILVFIWNLESGNVKWQARIRELYQPYDKGTPQYWKGWWREGFKAPAFGKNFQDPEEKQATWYNTITDDSVSISIGIWLPIQY